MTGAPSHVDLSTPAVVLKFDPNVMHHGGLGVIRNLGRLGVPVYGVHEGPWAPAANSRYLQGRAFWQPSPDDADRVQAGLLLSGAFRTRGRSRISGPGRCPQRPGLSFCQHLAEKLRRRAAWKDQRGAAERPTPGRSSISAMVSR
jgi:hypothetical protein